MGNSTLDCLVFRRMSGIATAEYLKKNPSFGKLTLEHLKRYKKMMRDAGINTTRKAPILFPDYRGKAVLARKIDIF